MDPIDLPPYVPFETVVTAVRNPTPLGPIPNPILARPNNSRYRNWCFTSYPISPHVDNVQQAFESLKLLVEEYVAEKPVKYIIAGVEKCPDTGKDICSNTCYVNIST